jgi:hypothetical protein
MTCSKRRRKRGGKLHICFLARSSPTVGPLIAVLKLYVKLLAISPAVSRLQDRTKALTLTAISDVAQGLGITERSRRINSSHKHCMSHCITISPRKMPISKVRRSSGSEYVGMQGIKHFVSQNGCPFELAENLRRCSLHIVNMEEQRA